MEGSAWSYLTSLLMVQTREINKLIKPTGSIKSVMARPKTGERDNKKASKVRNTAAN